MSVDRATRVATGSSLERAFDLARSGAVSSYRELVEQLRREGYQTVSTDLRGLIDRRELRRLIQEGRGRPASGGVRCARS